MIGIRWLKVFAALVFIACLFCISASARSVVDSGACGASATWTLYSDGELVIGGSGAMSDYTYTAGTGSSAPWMQYASQLSSLQIGADITRIGNNAFRGCSGFTGTLTLPAGMRASGASRFTAAAASRGT